MADPYPEGYRRQIIGIVLGIAVFAAMLTVAAPAGMPPAAWKVAACTTLMAIWWLTEALPVAATALVPMVLFPPLGIATIAKTTAPYAHPLIFLFMGGFMIALAMQRWNLHKRIALGVLRVSGSTPERLVGGFMGATAFLSMWVSNTATTVMMVPIALSVVALIGDEGPAEGKVPSRFTVALLLAIAYAASIGGMATLIGTPPNALMAGFLAQHHGIQVGFAQWMIIGLPLSILMLVAAWLLLTRVLFRSARDQIAGAEAHIAEGLAALGPITAPERRVAVVFVLVAAAWIFRPLLAKVLPGLSDTGIAICAAVLLFVIPAGTRDGRFLLNWDWARRLPWGVLILFGGGLTLAAAISQSGLAGWIGEAMKGLDALPLLLIAGALTALVVFLTELTSNTATAATFLPLAAALAAAVGAPPAMLVVPAALAASCAFMMPVATPPNAIVFGSGMITVGEMARAGIWLNIVATVVITAAVWVLVPVVFG
jgi:sodium-dependent dicarboxylate transporter 2/3/5